MPQPDIVWYKDALPIDPVKMPRYRVLVGGSLQVNGLLPDDTGMFQCFARNVAGEVQTNTYLAVTSECSRHARSLLEKSGTQGPCNLGNGGPKLKDNESWREVQITGGKSFRNFISCTRWLLDPPLNVCPRRTSVFQVSDI